MKAFLAYMISKVSPGLFFRLAYLHNRGRLPRLNRPKDISEILISKVLNGSINSYYHLADKYLVRDYISKKGYDELLTPLIGCFSHPDEIDFASLPDRFAIKMNYGAGMNIICTDREKLNIVETKDSLNKWLNRPNYSNSERHYNLINRKIVIEEFIDDGSGGFPTDYKFMCIHGKVVCILACSSRETGHTSYAPFDLNWNYLSDYDRYNRAHNSIPRPDNLADMIKIAEDLSHDFDVIRVDLYSNGSKIWFGEMTLTPSGCLLHGWTQKALDDMGQLYNKTK